MAGKHSTKRQAWRLEQKTESSPFQSLAGRRECKRDCILSKFTSCAAFLPTSFHHLNLLRHCHQLRTKCQIPKPSNTTWAYVISHNDVSGPFTCHYIILPNSLLRNHTFKYFTTVDFKNILKTESQFNLYSYPFHFVLCLLYFFLRCCPMFYSSTKVVEDIKSSEFRQLVLEFAVSWFTMQICFFLSVLEVGGRFFHFNNFMTYIL